MVHVIFGYSRQGWDGENDAFTKLLLTCNGADGATSFPDSSPAAHTVSANGNAQIDTARSKFGSFPTLLLDGSGDYLSSASHADWSFGTGDFTVDLWVRFNSVSGTQYMVSVEQSGAFTLLVESGTLRVARTGTANDLSYSWSPSTGVWYHVAVSRASNAMKLFVDGAVVASGTVSSNYGQGVLGVGARANGSNYFNGWMDEVRISKGIARWTANFTPYSRPYPPIPTP
jgi:hypothetical protein